MISATLPQGHFGHTIALNSVAQYFPNAGYPEQSHHALRAPTPVCARCSWATCATRGCRTFASGAQTARA